MAWDHVQPRAKAAYTRKPWPRVHLPAASGDAAAHLQCAEQRQTLATHCLDIGPRAGS
jgi:hypothetical protein